MTTVEDIAPPKAELQEVEMNSQESTGETTTELFRREASPPHEEASQPKSPKSPSSPSSPRPKTPSKLVGKSVNQAKKEETIKKKSSSGIPLRLRSNTASGKRMGSYRHAPPPTNLGPVINRNTLEMQFINNKKRLMQLQAELVEKQRPLLDMHKSLLRTKKQLEEMGKKVVLDEIKIVALKPDDAEAPPPIENILDETMSGLKSSIDSVLDSCLKVSKRCMLKRDHAVKILEDMSKSVTDVENFEMELEELKREKEELESSVDNTFMQNEAKINELLVNWQKMTDGKTISEETTEKIAKMEATIAHQQKTIAEAEESIINMSKKFEEKRATYEKTINEMNEKNNKLKEELKTEKRLENENSMRARNLRSKLADLEAKARETEEKYNEASKKLGQAQEQMRKKEVQWLKEKDEFKKNEELLQQKFNEKQSQLDTRLKDMERMQKTAEQQQQKFYNSVETQLEIKEHELEIMEKEKEKFARKTAELEEQLEEIKKQMEEKDKEIEELSMKKESVPAIEYKPSDGDDWMELIEYKKKINEMQNSIQEQSEQISRMQNSLKAHAQMAAALKLEKDNAVKYSNKLREVLQEARDEIDHKKKVIYNIHEKLVLKEKTCDKLKAELKEYSSGGDWWQKQKNRCQICMSSMESSDRAMDYSDAEVGKSIKYRPKYVSDSLIGMSVKKVDHLRARLDNLKKMKLPFSVGKNQSADGNPFLYDSDPGTDGGKSANHRRLHKQIELRGKLYQILQKHADQSCEDFINLLKLSVSKGSRDTQELKPSNIACPGTEFSSNIKITEAFSQYIDQNMFNQLYNGLCDNEDFGL